MFRISTATRIALSLTLTSVGLIMTAHLVKLIPDVGESEEANRRSLCESVAIQCCVAAEKVDTNTMRILVDSLVRRNPQILSAAVRHANGKVLSKAGDHPPMEGSRPLVAVPGTMASVPIYKNQQEWGRVEMQFRRTNRERVVGMFGSYLVPLVICLGGAIYLATVCYLRKTLTYLDPSSVIPDRVQRTLDTLTEGIVLMDKNERVVMANATFAKIVDRPTQELVGCRISSLPWIQQQTADGELLPWVRSIRDGSSSTGAILKIVDREGKENIFAVNAAPITSGDQVRRGALATFDDLTSLESKNAKLSELLAVLEKSREEIRAQNAELQFLATRDPLTHCLNRRSFFTQMEEVLDDASGNRAPMGCVMVDVDHFKSINDNHGHAMGDQVLQHVSSILRGGVQEQDFVCRYGGEEFCLVLVGQDLAAARETADRIRQSLESSPCGGLRVTASLGVAPICANSNDLREVMDQADKCLYYSKRHGRNRVTTWQELMDRGETDMAHQPEPARTPASPENLIPVSLKAIHALFKALEQRDPGTAEHSRRVANLCMALADGLIPERDSYILESAALLHDIGKLGVPDAVLHKPGALTEDEKKLMATHTQLGADIVELAFGSSEMHELIRTHDAWYGGHPQLPHLPIGTEIPLGARILAIAEAYDAIVSDQVYRRGRGLPETIEELRRCSGTQFDPELVERFVGIITTKHASSTASSVPEPADTESAVLAESLQTLADMKLALAQGTPSNLAEPSATQVVESM